MSEVPPNQKKNAFKEAVHALLEQTTTQNPEIEGQMASLAEQVGQEESIDVTGLRVSQIRERLSQHKRGAEKAGLLEAREQLHTKVARYLKDLEEQLPDVAEELTTFASVFGVPRQTQLTEVDVQEVERYLLGDAVYDARLARSSSADPAVRVATLRAFLKATARQGYRAPDPQAPWRDITGPTQRLQERALGGLTASAYLPLQTLAQFIAREGSDELLLRSPLGSSEKPLADLLDLPGIKARIDALPDTISVEARSSVISGEINAISKKIRELIPYAEFTGSIARIQNDQITSCIGYATLGILALRELGIPTVLITATKHAFLGFVLPDGKVYKSDFQGGPSSLIPADALDHQALNDVSNFITSSSPGALPVRLSRGTKFNWWNKVGREIPEMLYLYKDIEPALVEWAIHRMPSKKASLPAQHFLEKDAVIEEMLTSNDRGPLISLLEHNPNDPRTYDALISSAERGSSERAQLLKRWSEVNEEGRKSSDYGLVERFRSWLSSIRSNK